MEGGDVEGGDVEGGDVEGYGERGCGGRRMVWREGGVWRRRGVEETGVEEGRVGRRESRSCNLCEIF